MTETTKHTPLSEERLAELIAGAEFRIKHDIAVQRGMEDWLSALRELKALRQENEWISVETRLPESSEVVITSELGGLRKIRYYADGAWRTMQGFRDADERVTHWRALPTPPAPRTEEK